MNNLYIQAFTLRQKYQNDPDALGLFLSSIHLTQPGLALEVFSGLDNHVKVRVLDRFYSNISSAVKSNAGHSNTIIVWPATRHDFIITEAFDVLDKSNQTAIQRGSRRTDHESFDVPTLIEENAPQHAMTPAAKVRELKSVEKAREWARNEARKFLQQKLALAKTDHSKAMEGPKQGLVYWSTRAYEFFGEAMHPVMDNWSPAHRDFQVYDGSELPKGAATGALIGSVAGPIGTIAGAAIGGYMTTTEHTKIESRVPTEDELNSMIDEMRLAYEITFGGTVGAVSNPKMQQSIARLNKRGYAGMLIK